MAHCDNCCLVRRNALDHEDRLFRAAMRRNPTPAGLSSLRRLVDEIVEGDHDRLGSATQVSAAALIVADAAHPGRLSAEVRT